MQRFSPKASSVMEKKIFKGFYHIWAWRPSWSTNRDHFSNLSFPHPKEAPYEIWAKLAQRLQRRSRLKMLTDGRTDARTDGRRTKSDHNSSSWAELRWAKYGDNINECHLSAMSQQTTTATNRASVMHAVIHAWYMSGLISRPVYIAIVDSGPRGPPYIGATLYFNIDARWICRKFSLLLC